jgi:phosphatidylglycerophosphate synthase
MKYIPNILSTSRIFMGAIILFIYPLDDILFFNISIAIIGIAGLTDILDGKIARKYNAISKEGYILDGLGDRSFYVSLVLMIFIKYNIYIIIVWLLIYREILLYAIRLITPNWRSKKKTRKISLLHALGLRLWIFNYLLADGLKYYSNIEISTITTFKIIQYSIVIITILIAYYAIYIYLRTLLWGKK